ncbi:hypothetical protein [Actinomyces sp.]|uniref:hypothetical protein n=1 Tax=Actinomyces sp. TaxID=29317 RepID=UPI00289EEACD|nr:hypothetical protein [Actinomyces sp.]
MTPTIDIATGEHLDAWTLTVICAGHDVTQNRLASTRHVPREVARFQLIGPAGDPDRWAYRPGPTPTPQERDDALQALARGPRTPTTVGAMVAVLADLLRRPLREDPARTVLHGDERVETMGEMVALDGIRLDEDGNPRVPERKTRTAINLDCTEPGCPLHLSMRMEVLGPLLDGIHTEGTPWVTATHLAKRYQDACTQLDGHDTDGLP